MSSGSEQIFIRNRLVWEDSSDSDSSDSQDELFARIRCRAARNFRIRVDHFTRWSDNEFRMRFRLSKETVMMLESKLKESIAPKTQRQVQ